MGWNPLRDIRRAVKKIEDAYNDDLMDDVMGIESVSRLATGTVATGYVPAAVGEMKTRVDDKIDRAGRTAADAVRKAQEARDMPTILANQARAARRKKLREQSLMAGGASDSSGGAMLSSVLAMGKQSLGA